MKKNYQFKYGDKSVTIPVDENQVIQVINGNDITPLSDIRTALLNSLDTPIDSEPLSTIAQKAGKIALIVSDMTRYWMRQDVIVPLLIDYLVSKCGKSYDDLEIIIATGTHIGGEEEELRKLVTSAVFDKVRTVNHDCKAEDLVYLGTTSYGTDVKINKDAAEADLVICLGAATYHVMAGFGGGRKSILPGISGLETIKHNHAYSLHPEKFITNPEIGNGILEGNPLNEDMLEAAAMVKNLFMVTLVTDTEFRLASIFSGHWKTSWLRACDEVRRIYTVPIKEKADVVITSCGGYPKDESLYPAIDTEACYDRRREHIHACLDNCICQPYHRILKAGRKSIPHDIPQLLTMHSDAGKTYSERHGRTQKADKTQRRTQRLGYYRCSGSSSYTHT